MSTKDGEPHTGYEHLRYRGGWLIERGRGTAPRGWRPFRLGSGFRMWVARGAPLTVVRHRGVCIALLGRPIDPLTNSAARGRIAESLVEAVAAGTFLERLDELTGRFVVAVNDGDGPRVYQDAAGTRAVFYRPGHAASHSALAAREPEDLDPAVVAMWSRISRTNAGVKYLAGIRAPHRDVLMLTPNTSLHVPTGTVERFWPRTQREESCNLVELSADVARLLEASVRRATATWPVCASLTAGLDSRLTLAACRRSTNRLTFFSHICVTKPNPIHQLDLEVAQEIADTLGLSHSVYPIGEAAKGDGYEHFLEVWRDNLGIHRGVPSLTKGYVDRWPAGTLHLRSNVAEIGRVFYKGKRLERIDSRGLARWWNPGLSDDPAVLEAFDEFQEVAAFNDTAMHGYDPLDLFYWEHRMGSWHSWLCLETDVAHDTLPIYSNRRLLTTMLAAPFEHRQEATLFHRAINVLWPEAAAWPINGNPRRTPRPS